MTRILLVEDELTLGETIFLSLKKMGHDPVWVKSLKEAKFKMSEQEFSLILLDRNLPDGEGLSLLKADNRGSAWVLVLSSKSGTDERVQGLKKGADDYLPKPFSFKELEARVEALLRRRKGGDLDRGAHTKGLWTLDETQYLWFTPRGEVMLTPLEFKFVSYLLEREGTIVSKDRLLKDVWGFSFLPKTRTVDYFLTQLRRRIEPEPDSPKHLLTIRGAGVKFVRG